MLFYASGARCPRLPALCSHPAETQSHIQCLSGIQGGPDPGHNMAQLLWKGIEDAAKQWTIVTEQTVAGLQGLPQPEERIDAWQQAWDEVDDLHLEVEEVQADADMAAQRKRPDASSCLGCKLGKSATAHTGVYEAERQG